MTGFNSKRDMANNKDALFQKFEVAQPVQEPDALTIAYQSGFYDGKKAAQRPWVGLTDEEIHGTNGYKETGEMYQFALALIAKIKERNS